MYSKHLVKYIAIITRFGVDSKEATEFEKKYRQDTSLMRRVSIARRQYRARARRIKRST